MNPPTDSVTIVSVDNPFFFDPSGGTLTPGPPGPPADPGPTGAAATGRNASFGTITGAPADPQARYALPFSSAATAKYAAAFAFRSPAGTRTSISSSPVPSVVRHERSPGAA